MTPQFIEANGLRVAYLSEGTGPLVLLLHGFPDTAHTWDKVRPALAKAGYRAVSPFLRGYHPTAIPTDGKYDSDTLGRDALALIGALGEQKAIVVGHDWGASAAYSAAALGKEQVRFLVTVAIPHPAAIRPLPRILWGARHFLRFQFPRAEAMTRANDFAYVDKLVQRWSPMWQVPPTETLEVKECLRQPGSLKAALSYYLAAVRGGLPRSHRLRIDVPSAAFAGTHDGILTVADYERARRRYNGPYEVVAMPGGHFCHREHPEHFNKELLRVLGAP